MGARTWPPQPTRRQLLLAAAGLALGAAQAAELPPEVQRELEGARLQGRGRLRFVGMSIYEARLWTLAPLVASDWATAPLALEIEYARALDGKLIAERSLKEMRRQGELAAATAERWLAQMKALFPNVGKGDRITGVLRPGEGMRFFVNGVLKGEVRDAIFARHFVGIWLAPQSSEPGLREALLGAKPAGS
jgi:Chalcone isomerase-like